MTNIGSNVEERKSHIADENVNIFNINTNTRLPTKETRDKSPVWPLNPCFLNIQRKSNQSIENASEHLPIVPLFTITRKWNQSMFPCG